MAPRRADDHPVDPSPMTELALFTGLLYAWFAVAALAFVALQFLSAPYGRHIRAGWGPRVPAALAWVAMETPPVVIFIALFALGDRTGNIVARVFLAAWLSHYIDRAYIYPFRARMRGKQMPIVIAALGLSTNLCIDYLNARWLFAFGPVRPTTWLGDPRFLIGAALFVAGWLLNRYSDGILLALRRRDDGYHIPRGGMFRWVSCPNYLGEMIEWAGWALATWSLPGLAFAVWTAANLAPRAAQNHRWYRERFADYPRVRRALIPFVY